MNIQVSLHGEYGYDQAMLGLSLSYHQRIDKMPEVARRLYQTGISGETKFLEAMQVWLLIDGPRYWWQQFDTYRVGITKQSESTMHTIMRRKLRIVDFVDGVSPEIITLLNASIERKDWQQVKRDLPEGFIQTRLVCTNYKTLGHIIRQRENHRLPEWQEFCEQVRESVAYPEFLVTITSGKE